MGFGPLPGGGIGGTTGTTDNAITRADGTGGSTLQGSLATIADDGTITAPALRGTFQDAFGDVLINGSNANASFNQLTLGLSGGVILIPDAANTLALRNGANAQTLNVYATYTDGSNYAALSLSNDSGNAYIVTNSAGTGPARGLIFYINNAPRWTINTSGHFLTATDNTYDIGASGANRPRNVFAAGSVVASTIWFNSAQDVYAQAQSTGVLLLSNGAGTSFGRLQLGGTTSSFPAIKCVGATIAFRLADDSADCDISAARVIASAPVRFKGYTVATLPSGITGDNAYVTDALAPTFLATVVGGGAIVTPVFYNGSAWVGA